MLISKEELRKEILRERKRLDPRTREELSARIVRNILSLPEFNRAERVLLYCPVRGEPDVSPLFEKVLERGSRLILPRVSGEELELVYVEDLSLLSPGSYGIPEPSSGEVADPEDVDFAVVPGLVFDRQGYRIGFGKGYYDRLLKKIRAPKAGVAYSFQVLGRVPKEEWDEPVDLIVTEKGVIRRL